MKCAKCGQEVPEGAVSCPRCSDDRAQSGRAATRAGLVGGLKGFFLGLLPSIWLLVQFAGEQGTKAAALVLPVAMFATGFIIGLIKAKRESK